MQKKIKTERLIWIDVTITLLALELMTFFYYGARALVLGGVCIAVSLAAELISLRLMHRKFTADDLTCTSDALITALMLPAVIRYEIPAIACVFAVVAAKNIFGGRLNMIFSPAAAAYLFMLTSWGKELLHYSEPYTETGIFEEASGLVNSASHVLNTTGKMAATDFEILLGNFSGPMGTVSVLLLLVAAAMLILRKDISVGAFIGTVLGTGFLAYLCPIASNGAESVKYVFATNMILFAAIYIISDVRIAPKKNYYAFFYGFFIAVASYVIMLTTGRENVIVIMSVIFTPVSLALKNLEKKIEEAEKLEAEQSAAAEIENKLATEENNECENSSEEDNAVTEAESEEEEALEESFGEEILAEKDSTEEEEAESAEEKTEGDESVEQ